jgi:thioredoxin 1
MPTKNVFEVSDKDFQALVLDSDQPVLVDFWAEWCGPCRQLAPTIDSLAVDFEGKAKVAKIDVDANGDTAARYGIRSIPSVLVFKGGQLVDQFVGRQSKDTYVEALNKLINV